MNNKSYSDKIHLVGRVGSIMAMAVMLGIPALICTVYDVWPSLGEVFSIAYGLLAIFIPTKYQPTLPSRVRLASSHSSQVMPSTSSCPAPFLLWSWPM